MTDTFTLDLRSDEAKLQEKIERLEARVAELEAKCNQRRDDLKQARDILDERFKRIAELEAEIKQVRAWSEDEQRKVGEWISQDGLNAKRIAELESSAMCIWEDCDQQAIYCEGHANELVNPLGVNINQLRSRIAELERRVLCTQRE